MQKTQKKFTLAVAINTVKEFVAMCYSNNLMFDKVILFGSVVNRTTGRLSDIDVAFVSKKFKNDPVEDRKILNKLAFSSKKFLDIETHTYSTEYFKQGDPLINEIKKTGIAISVK